MKKERKTPPKKNKWLGGQFKTMTGKTDEDYLAWCKEQGISPSKKTSIDTYCDLCWEELKRRK